MTQSSQVNLEMGEDPPAESSTRNNVLHRLDSVPRASPGIRSNVGLGDRLNSVFREIRPLVENARMGNNTRLSLPTWLPVTHTPEAPRPQSSIAHVNLGPNAQTYAITDRHPPLRSFSQPNPTHSGSNDPQEPNVPDTGTAEINVSVNPANNNNIHEEAENDSHSDDGVQQVLDVRATLNMLIRYAPFYLILFIKLVYDSREALFTFCVLFVTFSYGNTLVRREHGKQANRNLFALLLELVFTSCVLTMIHYFIGHGKLLTNVVMYSTFTEPIDVWELLWLVVMSDLIVKIITVNIKIVVTMMPACLLPYQKRGKIYLFVEAVSQLYRSVLTVQPWAWFLLGSYTGSERVVGMFLASVYAVAKLAEMLIRIRLLRKAAYAVMQSTNLGTKPTGEQMVSAGDSCPICHDDYTTPVRLACTHIFCELCISAWLDREHTCPLCRAKVADEPLWRDGSTTYDFQLY